ncbi:nitronate monooxygenase [Nocardia sp. NBC_01503]|uniref:NAD(P)H-dependent flavin oxidoreductase n=1 Tax=Nocardia sp. NBC_01503 TaxID=2975997 RepID=UPI002E7BAFDE|nr:nitronate monooxygenase [Nocardia sp. NBC_01503]WTL36087.1 nitronate monooxygenase [Nocardia sp. NBC_01503]
MPEPELSTAWSRAFGLSLPVVNAPMGGVAGGRLAAAVTRAGGLGMIGMGSAGSVAALERELPHLDGVPGPFGIGLVDWVIRAEPGLLPAAIAARPALISVSFGTDMSWVPELHEAGILAATQVFTLDDAHRAQDAGVDVLVARGSEGGGHGAVEVPTLPLLESIVADVPVPVLAAGGIATAQDLAVALAAGASGVWLGTCLAACAESMLSDRDRGAMLAATAEDTLATRVFDVAMELPWPARFPARVLRNAFTDRWSDRIEDLPEEARTALRAGRAAHDPDIVPIDAGICVGAVTEVRPVAQVLDDLCSGAANLL